MDYLLGQEAYGLEMVGKDAVSITKRITGDQDPMKAEQGTIRALYGSDPVRNCIHVSASPGKALKVV